MTENGNGNDEKTRPERDEMGRFKPGGPGGPGGPGRGKRADKLDPAKLSDEEFWDAMESLIRRDMMSEDVMIRQRAMKLKVMKDEYLLKKNAETKVKTFLSDEMREYFEWKKRNDRQFDFTEYETESD